MFSVPAAEYGYNASEASCEVRYEPLGSLMELQEDVIALANPLREGLLLERDPAGHPLRELIERPGCVGDNIHRTGFDAVGDPADGGLFHPHVTINWFAPGTSVSVNAADWPAIAHFTGRFTALGMYVLGPYGTCVQRLEAMDIAG